MKAAVTDMYDFSPIADYMEQVVMGEHHVPGCDILIMRDHELLFRHICGYSDREQKLPLTDAHLYFM